MFFFMWTLESSFSQQANKAISCSICRENTSGIGHEAKRQETGDRRQKTEDMRHVEQEEAGRQHVKRLRMQINRKQDDALEEQEEEGRVAAAGDNVVPERNGTEHRQQLLSLAGWLAVHVAIRLRVRFYLQLRL